jgi:hypothetical protein
MDLTSATPSDLSSGMRLTSFGFVETAERFLRDALSLPPVGGGSWEFQRTVNLADHSAALQVIRKSPDGGTHPSGMIRTRLTGKAREAGLQGWLHLDDDSVRQPFVVKEMDAAFAEEEIFEIVEDLLENMPERDSSVQPARPDKPKREFKPLVEEAPPEPVEPPQPEAVEPAGPLLSPDDDAPPAAMASTSVQEEVDRLLNPDNAAPPPPAEEVPAEPKPKTKRPRAKKSEK